MPFLHCMYKRTQILYNYITEYVNVFFIKSITFFKCKIIKSFKNRKTASILADRKPFLITLTKNYFLVSSRII